MQHATNRCARAIALAITTVLAGSASIAAGAAIAPATAATTPQPILINTGGSAYTDSTGRTWAADTGATGGKTSNHTSAITGTTDDKLYQQRRYAMSTYQVKVPTAGTYDVALHFAETYFTSSGKRIFSVTAENQPIITDLDLYKTAGKNRAHVVHKNVTITDGTLNLGFTAKVDNAVLAGIELTKTTNPAPPPAPAPAPAPPGPAPAPGSGTVKNRSGLPWNSGVYNPGSSKTKSDAFATWRGRPLDVVVDWPARATWNDFINPTWLYDRWSGTPYTKVFGVPMVPEKDSSATIANCASGTYNDKWRQFGTNIKKYGLDDETIIRLSWEFNGNWYKWQAKDPAAWAQCWRNIVTNAESTAPALRWDWNVNRGPGQTLRDATKAYPGDAYVDIIGIDSYDGWPGATTEATWQEHYSGPFGLKFWADFANAHGKKLSVPEWGVYPGTAWAGHNGGDNPFYINKMVDFFTSQGSNLAYEAYFNEPANYYAGSIYGPNKNPKAAAAYLNRYHQ